MSIRLRALVVAGACACAGLLVSCGSDAPPPAPAAAPGAVPESRGGQQPVFDTSTGSWRTGAGNVAAQRPQSEAPHLIVARTMPTSGTPYELHLVQTRDEIYVPLGVRKPDGDGPFPAILVGSGNGNGGFSKIEQAMYRLEGMMDEMLKRGYVVAYGNYRNEIPGAYNSQDRAHNVADTTSGGARALKSACSLDSDDYISLIEHLQNLPYVKRDGVGTVGVSHSGELMFKVATEITWGAAAAIEPAVHEFLAMDRTNVPRIDNVIQMQEVAVARGAANLAIAKERVSRMSQTPFLVMGRDGDHNQGLFRLGYEVQAEAGRDVTWASANHPVHGYGLLYRKDDGTYAPDEMQREFFDDWMKFFDERLKK
ncbi:MAG: hypothetical protein AB1806_19675 [Acidobacteriota bacterium]